MSSFLLVIALPAKRLNVGDVVAAAFRERHDMIDSEMYFAIAPETTMIVLFYQIKPLLLRKGPFRAKFSCADILTFYCIAIRVPLIKPTTSLPVFKELDHVRATQPQAYSFNITARGTTVLTRPD